MSINPDKRLLQRIEEAGRVRTEREPFPPSKLRQASVLLEHDLEDSTCALALHWYRGEGKNLDSSLYPKLDPDNPRHTPAILDLAEREGVFKPENLAKMAKEDEKVEELIETMKADSLLLDGLTLGGKEGNLPVWLASLVTERFIKMYEKEERKEKKDEKKIGQLALLTEALYKHITGENTMAFVWRQFEDVFSRRPLPEGIVRGRRIERVKESLFGRKISEELVQKSYERLREELALQLAKKEIRKAGEGSEAFSEKGKEIGKLFEEALDKLDPKNETEKLPDGIFSLLEESGLNVNKDDFNNAWESVTKRGQEMPSNSVSLIEAILQLILILFGVENGEKS